jgi:hypothetical protein
MTAFSSVSSEPSSVRLRSHPGRALDHAHQQARGHAVTGHVDDVGGPLVLVLDDIDEVAADLAAGDRQAAHLERWRLLRQGRHEHAMDLPGQLHLRT